MKHFFIYWLIGMLNVRAIWVLATGSSALKADGTRSQNANHRMMGDPRAHSAFHILPRSETCAGGLGSL
jgi:hypothetical protein